VRGHRGPEALTPILAAVRAIPRGRVATYGQIARLAGLGGQARRVGYALSALPAGSRVPWHRVVNAAGRISERRPPKSRRRPVLLMSAPRRRDARPGDPAIELLQRRLLEREGVRFDRTGRIDLARFRWRPRAYSSAETPRRARGSPGRRTKEDA
jgi:methylated-DNA-protein-cysteine methyltransferase related protein